MPKQTKTETAPKQTKTATPKTEKPAKVEKTAKAEKPAKSSKKKEATPAAPAPAPVQDATAEQVVAATEPVSVTVDFSEFMTRLNQLSTAISTMKSEFRTLEKKATRELKSAAKVSSKRNKRKTGNRSPSGFVKPALISDELAKFLGKSSGTQMARTEVTREINSYIRENKLQDKANGRRINADAKLSSLLKLSGSDELTYFNLQRYMSPQFSKVAAPAPATA